MALEAGGVDPGAVSIILNRLKSQGIFDQFRRDCLADVDTKPAYQNLRQRVESYVSNFLSRFTWTPEMNKNQLRDRLRRQINQSDMLASGVDRIIEQVVEPKMQHVFRPQIEMVVNQYLHSETVNGDNTPTKNGTVPHEYPPVTMMKGPPLTPPEENVETGPKTPSPPPEQPPLPPTPAIDDDEKMPPPPQPPPPPLPPSTEELTINTEDPAILPSPAFEPIGSSPPHPGASFLHKSFVDSPIPEPLSDGSPEQMDLSLSTEDSFKVRVGTDPLGVKSLIAKAVLCKKGPQSQESSPRSSPLTGDGSPFSGSGEKKPETKRTGVKKVKRMDKDSSSPKSKTKALEGQKVTSDASSPGTWSNKSNSSLTKWGRKFKSGESPGPLSTPSTPEKTAKSEYERKLEIQRKVENLIKQNIKIRDKRDSTDSSGGDSSPEIRYRGSSEHRRTAVSSPDRHREYRSQDRRPVIKRSLEPMVRPEDALRAISPEVISDEELEKKSVKDGSDVERSEGELVSSDEDRNKQQELIELGNLSDITVSSVHTSDLSSFSDVSSSSSTSVSDNEDKKTKDSSGPVTNISSLPKQYQSRPSAPPHFDSSEDEATREERKRRIAVAKEERVRRRQQQREEKEKKLRLAKEKQRESQGMAEKPKEKSKIDEDLSPVSTDTDSRDEMGDSPEPKDQTAEQKPVKKIRRVSDEDKLQVEVFPAYFSSLSMRKRRQAAVKDSFLLTQKVTCKNLLRRKKKKLNNRSGCKLYFRMGGQSGGNTPKRSASPRLGIPPVSRPEGHLVAAAVAKIEEPEVVSYATAESGVAEMETAAVCTTVEVIENTTERRLIYTLAGSGNVLVDAPFHDECVLSESKITLSEKKGPEMSNMMSSENVSLSGTVIMTEHIGEGHDGVEEQIITSEDVPPDHLSSGPATPLMDETEEMDTEDGTQEKEKEGIPNEYWKEEGDRTTMTGMEGQIRKEGDVFLEEETHEYERTTIISEEGSSGRELEETPMESKEKTDGRVKEGTSQTTTEGKLEGEGVGDLKDVTKEKAQIDSKVEDSTNTDLMEEVKSDSSIGETATPEEKRIGTIKGVKVSADVAMIKDNETDAQKLKKETISGETGDKSLTESQKESFQEDKPEVDISQETDLSKPTSEIGSPGVNNEQTCKVVLHRIEMTPEMDNYSNGEEACAEPTSIPSKSNEQLGEEEGHGVIEKGTRGEEVSWVEEVGEGVVKVHDMEGNEDDDNPPTPTQDEYVSEDDRIVQSINREEAGNMRLVDTAGEEQHAEGFVGLQQDQVATSEHVDEGEEDEPSKGNPSTRDELTHDVRSVTDDPTTSEGIVERRSRRTVSDRHSKDEDFVYFNIRRKSSQRSQSPTPSLQSNESESSYTSSRSSRSSRRNSGRSVDMDDRKPDRKRHASQELPSLSLAEERPRRARRGSLPSRYYPSKTATQRVSKRKSSPSPTPQPQGLTTRRTFKHEHYTRHTAPSNRDSDFIYEMPKRRSERHSGEERPAKRKR